MENVAIQRSLSLSTFVSKGCYIPPLFKLNVWHFSADVGYVFLCLGTGFFSFFLPLLVLKWEGLREGNWKG
jgi:hypothetical protein